MIESLPGECATGAAALARGGLLLLVHVLLLFFALHAEALALDEDDFGMMAEPIDEGGSQGVVLVHDGAPTA